MTGYIIGIDGPDGTGKSGVCKRLCEEIDNSVYFPLPRGIDSISAGIYELIKNPHIADAAKTSLVYASHIHNNRLINRFKNEGKVVILDRTMIAFYAYQNITSEDVERLGELSFFTPARLDVYIHLRADKDKIIERIQARNSQELLDDYFVRNYDRIVGRFNDVSEGMGNPVVDTTTRTPDEGYDVVRQIIKDTLGI